MFNASWLPVDSSIPMPYKFGFDGQGINDYSNEYHNQLAKLTPAGKEAGIGHLLASAPELLEACKKVVAWYENSGNQDPAPGSLELWSACKKAISKAKGE